MGCVERLIYILPEANEMRRSADYSLFLPASVSAV